VPADPESITARHQHVEDYKRRQRGRRLKLDRTHPASRGAHGVPGLLQQQRDALQQRGGDGDQ
jgi:hypothetical protein